MPIFEFKCLKCNEILELLIMKDSDMHELKCKACGAADLERVMSTVSFAMGEAGSAGSQSCASVESKTCSSGSCHTYTIPGHSK